MLGDVSDQNFCLYSKKGFLQRSYEIWIWKMQVKFSFKEAALCCAVISYNVNIWKSL